MARAWLRGEVMWQEEVTFRSLTEGTGGSDVQKFDRRNGSSGESVIQNIRTNNIKMTKTTNDYQR